MSENFRAFSLPPDYFEVLREKALSVERVNNVDIVSTSNVEGLLPYAILSHILLFQ